MYTADVSNAQLILSYSDVFEDDCPNLIDRIKQLNMHKAISIISELIQIRDAMCDPVVVLWGEIRIPFETVIKQKYCGITAASPEEMFSNPLLQRNQHVISLQMLLLLLKKIIIYGDYSSFEKTNYTITDEDYQEIIKLQLVIAEDVNKKHREGELDSDHFLYSTYHLNYRRNVANEVSRMYYMMEHVSRDINNFDEDVQKEYRDYYSDFYKKYTLTPTEYCNFLFWELNFYFSNKNFLSSRTCWRKLKDIYPNKSRRSQVQKNLNILARSPQAYKEWAIETENQEWDFSKFIEFPFISDNNGGYISITEGCLINAFFEKIFWLIRDCYPEDDSRAMAFFGRLFEKYIQDASKNIVNKEYEYIDEFVIAKKKKSIEKSSDAYFKKGENLLVIEAKGFSVLIDCMIKNERIEDNNKKLFISPVLQADTCLNKTIISKPEFQDIKEAYIISVTMDSINAVPSYYHSIHQKVEAEKKCDKTKYYFNFSIEEYEMILWLIEQGEDIFVLLKDYFENKNLKPFSTYIQDKYPNIDMSRFLHRYYKEYAEKMKELLFDESDKSFFQKTVTSVRDFCLTGYSRCISKIKKIANRWSHDSK